MTIGVIFVNVVPGTEKVAYGELIKIRGIKDMYHVFGEFDFIIISDVGGLSELNRLVDTVRENENVITTRTIVGAEL